MRWSKFSDAEIERRRTASVDALKRRDREEFERRYQEDCDREYWAHGQCCAGCDFWNSAGGWSGECRAAGLVPADEVLASVGIVGWSGPKEPGFPITDGALWCGKFRDDFDWSLLDGDYLRRIGAMRHKVLKPKPRNARES